jgi:hypothetical protein
MDKGFEVTGNLKKWYWVSAFAFGILNLGDLALKHTWSEQVSAIP